MANIEYYRALLPVDKHELDDVLEKHHQLQEEIGRELNLAETAAKRAKDDVASVEARLFVEIKNSGDRISNEVVNAQVQTHRLREKAYDIMLTLQGQATDWARLYEAWQQRGWSIRGLGDLYSSEYFRLTSVGQSPPKIDNDVKRIRQEQRDMVQRRSFKS